MHYEYACKGVARANLTEPTRGVHAQKTGSLETVNNWA